MLSKPSFTNRLSYLYDKYNLSQDDIEVINKFVDISKKTPWSLKRQSEIWRFIRCHTRNDVVIGICVSLICQHVSLFHNDYLLDKLIIHASSWMRCGCIHQSIIFFEPFANDIKRFDELPIDQLIHIAECITKPDIYFNKQEWAYPSLNFLHIKDHLIDINSRYFRMTPTECKEQYQRLIQTRPIYEQNYYKAALILIYQRCRQIINMDETIDMMINFGGLN